MWSKIASYFVVFIVVHEGVFGGRSSISCRDSNGRPVDWWVIYKLPDMNDHHSQLVKWGVGFLYMDHRSADWELSRVSLNRTNHALSQTLQQYYAKKDDRSVYYALWNDDHPNEKKDSYRGHTKGVQLFDEWEGFWLIHSVPRFPHPTRYFYPQSGTVFGQSMMCVSFYTKQSLEDIAQQLRLYQPSIYKSQKPDWVDKDYPVLAEVIRKKSYRKGPFHREVKLRSTGGERFWSFAKHRKWGKDLYADFLAPTLKSTMFTETWMNGPGDLPSQCKGSYAVHNLLSVKPHGILFNTSKDHSKFAVSSVYDKNQGWVCVGDINRQRSQDDRGGGTMCIRSEPVWKAYRKSAERVECCKNGWKVPELVDKIVQKITNACGTSIFDKKLTVGSVITGLFDRIRDRI